MDEFHNGVDWPEHPGMPRWWWWSLLGAALIVFAVTLLLIGRANAETTKLSNCSQTVGASAAAVPFPASGKGPTVPTSYLSICNAHGTQTLGVNVVGGTAAIGSAGTLTLNPGGCRWWNGADIPGAASVVGSGASTTTECEYH